MSAEELTGKPKSPDCFHCEIANQVQAALKRSSAGTVTGALLQTLSELIASTAPNPESAAELAAAMLKRSVERDFAEFVRLGRRQPLGKRL